VARTAIADALDRLRLLLELAERRGLRGRIAPADFPLEMLLAAAPAEGAALARAALAPLEAAGADRGGALVETLSAFLEQDLDRRRTAQALHVHPNTVDYRLRRVRELTGLDLGRPADAAVLVLALRQRTLGE
jgi:DNA-binding PucR family transcriptional regulator